jgi:hypothetical protein
MARIMTVLSLIGVAAAAYVAYRYGVLSRSAEARDRGERAAEGGRHRWRAAAACFAGLAARRLEPSPFSPACRRHYCN